jgi:hypothetical protein
MAYWITEYMAHLAVRLCCVLVEHQAAMLIGSGLYALTPQQNGPAPAEIVIGRNEGVTTLAVTSAVTEINYSSGG